MKSALTIFLIYILAMSSFARAQDLLNPPRVKEAIKEKKSTIEQMLNAKKLNISNFHLLIIAFKNEKKLVVYAKHKDSSCFDILTSYQICASSGTLGPKRKEGDGQVPEGFYYISAFNPYSAFHLSLKINYPNESDKILSDKKAPGGDIFIHGSCVTIGCIPITDDKIKELYLLAAYASLNGQNRIPVYIFPFEMTQENFDKFAKNSEYLKNIKFWENLKLGYDLFVNNKKKLNYSIDKQGNYVFKTK